MKNYISPNANIISMEIEDVITASAVAPSSSVNASVPPTSTVAPTVSDAGLDNTVSADTWKQ